MKSYFSDVQSQQFNSRNINNNDIINIHPKLLPRDVLLKYIFCISFSKAFVNTAGKTVKRNIILGTIWYYCTKICNSTPSTPDFKFLMFLQIYTEHFLGEVEIFCNNDCKSLRRFYKRI